MQNSKYEFIKKIYVKHTKTISIKVCIHLAINIIQTAKWNFETQTFNI